MEPACFLVAKFRSKSQNAHPQKDSWFLTILRNSYFISFIRASFQRLGKWVQNRNNKSKKRWNFHLTVKALSKIVVISLLCLLAIAAVYVFELLKNVTVGQWLYLGKMLGLTFSRVLICVLISVAIMVPLGIFICATEKRDSFLQPVLQIIASFPATLLFPMIILILSFLKFRWGSGVSSLMLMGTQWYVLFNVIAGAKAIPSDLKEMTSSFQFSDRHRFFSLQLPAIVPYLITGVVTAAGGAWNASIVAEYVTYKNQVWTTPGIGSAISMAAQKNDYPLLAASILVMMVVVVMINYFVWLRLYHYSEKRFALNV